MGRRALLLDWGKADARGGLSVAGHVEELLLPLVRRIAEPVTLAGYCLGGTMAIAAANLIPVERVVTIAAPWNFADYPEASRRALADMWAHAQSAAKQLGALPMEVLQAAFWSLDPERTVRKFAEFGRLIPRSPEARRFVELEEWANEGQPLPYPAARELIEELFGKDPSGSGEWRVGGQAISDALSIPALHLTSDHDRIAPAATAPAGKRVAIPSGHVLLLPARLARPILRTARRAALLGNDGRNIGSRIRNDGRFQEAYPCFAGARIRTDCTSDCCTCRDLGPTSPSKVIFTAALILRLIKSRSAECVLTPQVEVRRNRPGNPFAEVIRLSMAMGGPAQICDQPRTWDVQLFDRHGRSRR